MPNVTSDLIVKETNEAVSGVVLALVGAFLSGCGGGGSDPATITGANSATCSQFVYQQQAQAYMLQFGATQLDGDQDGIACEALPRSSTSNSSGEASTTFASNTAFVTDLSSYASFKRQGDFALEATWSFLSPVGGYEYLRLIQGPSPELSAGYTGTRRKMQFARGDDGTLLGFGEWPGFSGYAGDGLGVEISEVLPSPGPLPTQTYIYLAHNCIANECNNSQGTLSTTGRTLTACPNSRIVTAGCVGLISETFSDGGPVWNATNGLGVALISKNGFFAYRRCSGSLPNYHCATIFAVAITSVRNTFTPPSVSLGRVAGGYDLVPLPASVHPTGVRSTSIPGLLFSEGSQAFLIQNSLGDYLLRGVEFRIVLQRR